MSQEKLAWGLFRRRQVAVPTWRGWLLLVLALSGCSFLFFRRIYPFLATTDSKPGGYLVIEGWAPDYASKEALQELNRQPYLKLFTTGGPLESGAPLSEHKTFAELQAATLFKLGATTNQVQAAPAPLVRQDRTYASAVALKKWLAEHEMPLTNINLLTIGPHARRSRMMFQEAFGKSASIGVIALAPFDYNQKDWWRSSQGFRGVTGEFIAYLYAKILFRPPKHPPEPNKTQ